jgi:hypothetical protein
MECMSCMLWYGMDSNGKTCKGKAYMDNITYKGNISKGKSYYCKTCMLIPQVRPAHKYPNSPWEVIHPPGGDSAVCM